MMPDNFDISYQAKTEKSLLFGYYRIILKVYKMKLSSENKQVTHLDGKNNLIYTLFA